MRERRTKRLKEQGVINRRFFSRKEKSASPRWWWNPPKLVPIIISVFALTISCLSWWESHRGRLINEEVNRPVLALTSLTALAHETHPNQDNSPVRVTVAASIQNIGNSTAYINRIDMRPDVIRQNHDACQLFDYSYFETVQVDYVLVLPKTNETFREAVTLSPGCRDEEWLIVSVYISLNYINQASGQSYTQTFFERFRSTTTDKLLNSGEEYFAIPASAATPKPTDMPANK